MDRWSLPYEVESGEWGRGKCAQGLVSNVSKGQRKEMLGSKKIWNLPEKGYFVEILPT